MAIVQFDPAAFKARFPEFANASDVTLSLIFSEAGLYIANTDASPVQDIARRTLLLYLCTAHIAYLRGQAGSVSNESAPAGTVTNATEGSVSVGIQSLYPQGSAAWFNSTQYGAQFWQATLSLRSFRYVAHPTTW